MSAARDGRPRRAAFSPAVPCALLAALALAAAPSSAQDRAAHDLSRLDAPRPIIAPDDDEAWIADLVDPPEFSTGAVDALAARWVARLAAAPGHPLAEATLALLASLRDEVDSPPVFDALVGELPAAGFSGVSRRTLQALQARAALARLPVDKLPAEGFPGYLREALVLGPLAPAGHPLPWRLPVAALHEPRFDEPHAGLKGEVRWRPLRRAPTSPRFALPDAFEPDRGVVVLALHVEAAGGPAWLEIDTGSGSLLAAVSLNGEDPLHVDGLGRHSPRIERLPFMLRPGLNRFTLEFDLEQRPAPALRLIDAHGHPLAGLVERTAPGPVSSAPGLPPDPSARLALDVEAWLASRAARGPDAEALLGLLQALDGRIPEGLHRITAACDAAPERSGLLALQARVLGLARHVPDSWKTARRRALAERVLAADPGHVPMAVHLARILAGEDREEEALALLARAALTAPSSSAVALARESILGRLGRDAEAEASLLAGNEAAPDQVDLLRRLASVLEGHGQPLAAAERLHEALRSQGASGAGLADLARRFERLGELQRAEELLREARARDDDPPRRLALARLLVRRGAFAEADALLAELAEAFPDWALPVVERADLARRVGAPDAERTLLEQALARAPSRRDLRERRAELTGEDATEALFGQFAVDLDAARAGYVDAGRTDSVVKLVDAAVVRVFADGGLETLTQDLWCVRDLEGCELLGTLDPPGEILQLATIKADGAVYEPSLAGGAYVMPHLQPGDFVVSVTRHVQSPPVDGVVRAGRWSFASNEAPFDLSRYVIDLPDALGLRLEQRRFSGEHLVESLDTEGGGRTRHVFTVRGAPRVQVEPHAPPAAFYLPWVEFGQDDDVLAEAARLALSARAATEVTPEIVAAAEQAAAGAQGDLQRARALYDFVNATLDQRGGEPATAALLGRQGGAAWLYAALLDAAGVPHELLWSRNVSPEAETEVPSGFVEKGFYTRKLLVRVHPRDAAPVDCDMDSRTLPFGTLFGDAPRAPALSLATLQPANLPDLPLEERPAQNVDLVLQLDAQGGARFEGEVEFAAGLGWAFKEPIREIPSAFRRQWVGQIFAQLLPGANVEAFELPGLDDPTRGVSVRARGTLPSFLDEEGGLLNARLPFTPLNLTAGLAGGEGERRLPYLLAQSVVNLNSARLEWPAELAPAELPAGLLVEWPTGRYLLEVEREDEQALVLRRRLALAPLRLQPAEYADFARDCARIDESERALLRFVRVR